MNKYLLVVIILFAGLLYPYIMTAQTWQWSKRGGSSDGANGMGQIDNVQNLATDPKGNVYVMSTIYDIDNESDINIDGHTFTGYGGDDICITSFTCDGTYRWTKIIGTGGNDAGANVRTDSMGGVYVTGRFVGAFGYGGLHIDTDTFINYNGKSFLMVKFDTAGNFKWVRMPEPDTVTVIPYGTYAAIISEDVAPDGTQAIFCSLPPGSYADGAFVVGAPSTIYNPNLHVIKFDANGNFISDHVVDITGKQQSLYKIGMRWDIPQNKYIFAGHLWPPTPYYSGELCDTLYFGTTALSHATVLGCFDTSGHNVWTRQNTDSSFGYGGLSGLDIDKEGDIYITGTTVGDTTTMNGIHIPTDSFNGFAFHNETPSTEYFPQIPFIVKMDINGNNLWASMSGLQVNLAIAGQVIAASTDTVTIAGWYITTSNWDPTPQPEFFTWGDKQLSMVSDAYQYNDYVVRFDAHTGDVISMDSVWGNTEQLKASQMTTDNYGNVYIGGYFTYAYAPPGEDTLYNIGGEADWYVSKFGTANCSAAIVDSDTTVTSGIPVTTEKVAIYPNPANAQLIVSGAASGTILCLYNIAGQKVYMGTVAGNTQCIDTRNLRAGAYILQLITPDGRTTTTTVMKE